MQNKKTKKTLDYKFDTLGSGLRLVCIPMPSTMTATVLVLVGTGSKYETKEINGISHFLEHMMFKGTTKRPDKLQIARELEGIGANFNAFTAKEYTGYYAKASASKLDIISDVVFDIFLNSRLAAEDIDVERGVIIEEINMYQDLPQRYVGELYEKLLYGDQPAGWDIAGEKSVIRTLQRDQFVGYFNSHYISSNTIVAVAGDINPDDFKKKTEKYFRNIRQANKISKLPVKESQSSPQALVHYKKTDQTHFIVGFRGYNMFDERRYAADVLALILGGGMSSRLFQEVRDKRGLAYYVNASQDNYTDSGIFAAAAGVNNDKADDAIKVIMAEFVKIKDKGVTAAELRHAKDQIEGSLAISLENSKTVSQAYAWPVLFENKVLTPEEELAKIKKVTLSDIMEVSSDIFTEKKMNLALIGPFKSEGEFKSLLKI